ncbi:MAG TPA: PAS domain-containing sensor histidine kinase [Candidatus Saccharimonadales bacterium]|jgi:signal transduction histidine kinase
MPVTDYLNYYLAFTLLSYKQSFVPMALTALGVAVGFWVFWRIKKKRLGTPGSVNKLAAALRDEKMKSSIIVNAIEDGVVLFDDQKIIRSFNPGAGIILSWKPEEAMNLDYTNIIKLVNKEGEALSDAEDPFQRVFKEKTTIRVNDAALSIQGGKLVPISLHVSPLIEDNGPLAGQHVYAAVAVFRDVTKERQEESQRAEFISTASHEMRTPVAAIEGYLALALNDRVSTVDSRARDYLEKAHTSTEHLGKLFQDLLTSAKAEDGRLSSHPVVIEMGEYLQQITEDLRFSAVKKGLNIEFAVGSSQVINAREDLGHVVRPLYYVLADADRLREVITNIFDNAVKYTDQGKISVGLTGNNEVVQFYVRDTGPGIPGDDLPHLFQKFYRVDNSATRTVGGTGLGLFICRKIVELYRGRVWAESVVGQGSTFFINLPRLSTQQAGQLQAAEANTNALPTITSLASS